MNGKLKLFSWNLRGCGGIIFDLKFRVNLGFKEKRICFFLERKSR